MSTIRAGAAREKCHEKIVPDWEERERVNERFGHPITQQMEYLLTNVSLLKFYERAISLRGNLTFLKKSIHH